MPSVGPPSALGQFVGATRQNGDRYRTASASSLPDDNDEVAMLAAVKLITAALSEMARDPKIGRAEALRRSMLAVVDKGGPDEAHPAFWAPFVLVGEGGSSR